MSSKSLSPDEVLSCRLRADNLLDGQAPPALPDVVGACGVQDSPPGSGLLSLGARLGAVTDDDLRRALVVDRSLARCWCMRDPPFIVPTSAAALFTTGVLPPDERARSHLIRGVQPALAALGLGLDETSALVAVSAREVPGGVVSTSPSSAGSWSHG